MKLKRATRFGLSLLLSLTFATHALALPNGNLPPGGIGSSSGNESEFPSPSQLPTDPETNQALPASPLDKLADYDLVETVFHYHSAYIEARNRMQDMLKQIGVDEFNRRLDQNKVSFNIENYGQVSFTTIDGEPIGRIKHAASGVSFLFLEKSLIEENSKHLKLYTARQHFDAGADRTQEYYDSSNKLRKLREGRDNVFVWLSDDENSSVEKIEQKPRFAKRSRAWWAEWFRATYQKPTGYNFRTGLLAGTTQAMVAAVVGATLITTAGMAGVGPAAEQMQTGMQTFAATYGQGLVDGLKTAIPSFVFGSTLGIWSRAFSTWRSRGNERTRFWKNTSVSIAFYMGIKAVTNGGIFQFNLLTGSQFVANLALKNSLKEPNYGFADLEAAERADQDWLKIKFPTFGKKDDGSYGFKIAEKPFMKRVDWNRSFKFYIPMNTLTLIDQIWFTWWMSEYLQGNAPWYMPWFSTAMLAAAVPLSWKLLMNFAHKKYPDAEKTKQFERESRKYLDARIVAQNSVAQLQKWKGGLMRLAGLDVSSAAEKRARQAEDEAIPRQKQAFEGQAYEGLNWFRPVSDLDCQSMLTGKKAI